MLVVLSLCAFKAGDSVVDTRFGSHWIIVVFGAKHLLWRARSISCSNFTMSCAPSRAPCGKVSILTAEVVLNLRINLLFTARQVSISKRQVYCRQLEIQRPAYQALSKVHRFKRDVCQCCTIFTVTATLS